MWAIERITTIPNGVSSEGFLRQTGLLESVSLPANGTVQVCSSTCTQLSLFMYILSNVVGGSVCVVFIKTIHAYMF